MPLEMQAALEKATLNALQAAVPTGLAYATNQSGRTFDGQPPPLAGNLYVAVWSDGSRGSLGQRTALYEVLGVNVTVSLRVGQPYDRWVQHRDTLETHLNRITELIGKDMLDYSITNAAEVLASFDGSGEAVGYREGLMFDGFSAVEVKGPEWFHADVDHRPDLCGLVQTVKFVGNKRIRRLDYLR